MDDDKITNDKAASKLSRKEFAKQLRKQAYARAKEHRANDPKQVAFKEAMKQRRRDANEVAKEQRKAAAREDKATARANKRQGATSNESPNAGDGGDANARRTALRDEKAAAREQLIALRAQTAAAREELVAMRMLTAVASVEDDVRAATARRALGRDEQKQADRTALERRLLMKIVPASKL